jgi:uncharacterized membrane protein HdeD (DUF308 family)
VQETPSLASEQDYVLDLGAGVIAAGLLLLYYLGESDLLRIVLALGFALFVPGRAIVTNWPRMTSWSKVAMPVVLSLALLTLLATITLWAHVWKPMDLFQVEAWLSLVGLCLGVARRNRHRPDNDAQPSGSRSRRTPS